MRLAPLPDDQWDSRTRAALSTMLPENRLNVRGAGNALATLARHPDLVEAFLTFNNHLLRRSTLPPRLRELAILRVAHRYGAGTSGPTTSGWPPRRGCPRRRSGRPPGERRSPRWTSPFSPPSTNSTPAPTCPTRPGPCSADYLDERQRMDLVFTIGGYGLLAMAFNTFGVEPEHER